MNKVHKTTMIVTILIVFFTVLPSLTGLVTTILYPEESTLKFYLGGEFFLYSLALYSSAFTSLGRFSTIKGMNSIVLVLLVMTSIFYTVIVAHEGTPDIDRVTWISLLFFVGSIFFFYVAQYRVSKQSAPDIEEIRRNASDKIGNKLA